MRGELPSQEQTTWSGNSRCSSVCLLARIEWNKGGQPETPARRSKRVISLRRLAFFQPIAVLAAARYCGAATTYSLLSPKSKEPQNTPNPLKHDTTRDGFVSVCSVCSVVKKNGIATQTQDHLPNRVGLLHQFVDHFVHEPPSEFDPFVDRRCRGPLGNENRLGRFPR